MMSKWQAHEAKARFGELIRKARADGPQIVTDHGINAAVVLSTDDCRRLPMSRPSFVDHLLGGPKLDDETVNLINHRAA